MKTKQILSSLLLSMFSLSLFAQSTSKVYLGVQLNREPLPPLLVKHLKLEPGEGLLIQNIAKGSPADRIGLEKDDIILRLNGLPTFSSESFVNSIGAHEPGQKIALTVMQSGMIRQFECQLEPIQDQVQWKYPTDIETLEIRRPGRIFHINPMDIQMDNIEPGKMPEIMKEWRKEFKFNFPIDDATDISNSIIYIYQHQENGHAFTVTIKGDPDESDSSVTVNAGDHEYNATPDNLESIPDGYQKTVKEDIEKARQSKSKIKIPKVLEHIKLPDIKELTTTPDKLQKELDTLKQRMDELEKKLDQQFEELKTMFLKSAQTRI